jgi:hypothetical protein
MSSIPALGPTQHHIQRVRGALSLGVKQQGPKSDTHLQLVLWSRKRESIHPLSICLHGVKLSFFYFNFNQQSEFTFYKLMLWLLQCLDEKSSSGESSVPQLTWLEVLRIRRWFEVLRSHLSGEFSVPQIRSIDQFLLSRPFSSLKSSVLRSGFTWVTSVVWCLLHSWWMTSCTYDMPRSACSVALETYHGASTIILRILDLFLWIIDMLDLLAQPHNSRPYVRIGMIVVL